MTLETLVETTIRFLVNGVLSRLNRRRNTRASEGGPPLGIVLDASGERTAIPFVLSPEERRRHTYLLGSTGCGKTSLIRQLVSADIASSHSAIVVDLRGDLYDQVVALLVTADPAVDPARVTLLDLRDVNRIIGFNPLAGAGDAHSRAYLVLDALRAMADSWGIQLGETLRNILILLAETDLSLLELEPLLTNVSLLRRTVIRSSDPYVRTFFGRYLDLSPERREAWYVPVLNKVTPLLGVPRLRLLLGAPNTIDLRSLIDQPGQIVLISLGVDRFHSAARLIGSLLIGALESAVMTRVDLPEYRRVPINLYVDEFETMATENFSTIVAEGRRFGLALTLSHQNLSQLPTKLRSVIRNNVKTHIHFQTGSVDARELRHELDLGEDDASYLLQQLPVGHAFVCRREDDPVLVRFSGSRQLHPSRHLVAQFTNRVHAAMGSLPAHQASIAIESRLSSRSDSRDWSDSNIGAVRHERTPRRRCGEAD